MNLRKLKLQIYLITIAETAVHSQSNFRIIGGEKAPHDEYPWFYRGYGCGGSLVAPDIILTAAHCGDIFSELDLEYENVIYHPAYVQNDHYVTHDFMVVKLSTPILTVTPVKLDDGSISSKYEEDKSLWTLGVCELVCVAVIDVFVVAEREAIKSKLNT